MATTWIVCGAHKGAGKTHVAQALAKVLPDALCAKLGCAPAKLEKPAHYFQDPRAFRAFIRCNRQHTHLVLEVNRWVDRRLGDVIIFVEGAPGHASPRPDVARLRAAAHIRIPGKRHDWEATLARHLPSTSLRRKVCAIFEAQARFQRDGRPAVRTKVWFVQSGKRVFGPGLAHLLQMLAEQGTLRAAAEQCAVSYRYAWGLLRTAERQLGQPLVQRQPGGTGGGRTTLTEEGQRLLGVFQKVNRDVEPFADRAFARHWMKESVE
jgi:molybdate transport system regulatory protein